MRVNLLEQLFYVLFLVAQDLYDFNCQKKIRQTTNLSRWHTVKQWQDKIKNSLL